MKNHQFNLERLTGETLRARVAAAALIASACQLYAPSQVVNLGRETGTAISRAGTAFAWVVAALPMVAMSIWLAKSRRSDMARFLRQARAISIAMLVTGCVIRWASKVGEERLHRNHWSRSSVSPSGGREGVEIVYQPFLAVYGHLVSVVFLFGAGVLMVFAFRNLRRRQLSDLVVIAGITMLVFVIQVLWAMAWGDRFSSPYFGEVAVVGRYFFVVFPALCVAAYLLPFPFRGSAERGATFESDRLSGWLHSELLGDLAALRRRFSHEEPSRPAVLGALSELDTKIRAHRLEGRLAADTWVSLAEVIAYQVRRFRDYIEFSTVPMVGNQHVDPATAQVLHRVLGDLLANAVSAGAHTVEIQLDVERRALRLAVVDDGPGIPDDRARSGGGLQLLEQSLTAEGGSLAIEAGSNDHGTRVSVMVPSERRKHER